jgi:hypothetical protein
MDRERIGRKLHQHDLCSIGNQSEPKSMQRNLHSTVIYGNGDNNSEVQW